VSAQAREARLREAVERLGDLIFAKDFAVIDEFDHDAVFVGSEADETARGLTELRARFGSIFSGAHEIRFDWDALDVVTEGDTGWFYTDGSAVVVSGGAERRLPDSRTGVLTWRAGTWRWRQFHGSEPAG
jgi:ketosteroid isomerase-like protein